MTYCVALKLERGLVLASDTRTNAGLDNVASFRKMHVWKQAGDRVFVLLTAGNLAVTQSVVSRISECIDTSGPEPAEAPATNAMAGIVGSAPPRCLMSAPTMFQAARHVGEVIREVARVDGPSLYPSNGFSASFLLAGQIRGEPHRLFQIYAEGNFIEATRDTPFFQIGEHKYGKPILDRVVKSGMRMGEAAKLVLLSFDSTLRSNLSVGMPIDLLIYRTDDFDVAEERRIEAEDPYFKQLSQAWSEALRDAFVRVNEYSTKVDDAWPVRPAQTHAK